VRNSNQTIPYLLILLVSESKSCSIFLSKKGLKYLSKQEIMHYFKSQKLIENRSYLSGPESILRAFL